MDSIKTLQGSADDGSLTDGPDGWLGWGQKSLDWDAYEIDWGISHGMQENIRVLTRKHYPPGLDTPRHIFEKRYDLTRYRKQDVKDVKKVLKRENSILQRLNHPHIVAYLGCRDIEKDTPRIYLEYCDGGDLRYDVEPPTPPQTPTPLPTALLSVNIPVYDDEVDSLGVPSVEKKGLMGPRMWTEARVWRLIYQVYSALAYLHYGVSISSEHEKCVYESFWDPIIHCDINPRNVVLSKGSDGEWDARTCDFGAARDKIQSMMSVTRGIGSPYYQPPELGKMQWSPKGDVWALAKTIHSLRKSFKPVPDVMKQILDQCRDEQPDARPSSLAVLELAHRHVDVKWKSLERELGLAKSRSLVFHAFLSISKQMDNAVPFVSDTEVAERSGQVHRLELLLHDGALNEFELSCDELQLAVLFTEYINSLKEGRRRDVSQSQFPAPVAHQDLLQKLLNRDLDPDEQWPISGWTALHIAAQQGSKDMVRRLLDAKANAERRDARGWTARQYASRIRALWGERERQTMVNLAEERAKRRLDRARVYILQRQLSSIQSNREAFDAVEEILRQAEEVEKSADDVAVKENMYHNAASREYNRNL